MSPHLDSFSNSCKFYFQRSLSIGNDLSKTEKDEEYRACEVVLEALEHQIINSHAETLSEEYKEFILSDRVTFFSDKLQACGLFVNRENLQLETTTHDQETLAKYTQIRDQQRRQAHKLQMEKRKKYLNKLMLASSVTEELGEDYVHSQAYLKEVRNIVKSFCKKYKGNIGTHSFLEGVNTLIDKQVHGTEVILWTFNGYTLSEASVNLEDRNDDKYMDEAVSLLKSFMVSTPNEDRIEKANDQEFESMYSFHIHNSISNSFLRYIANELPAKGDLHAKPSGNFEPLKGEIISRNNIDGKLDENFMSMLHFPGFRCEIL